MPFWSALLRFWYTFVPLEPLGDNGELIDPKQKYDSTDNSKDHSDRNEGESGLHSRNNDEVSTLVVDV